MAHFAKLDSNNIVEQVIVVSNDDVKDSSGTEVESIGIAFCQKLLGADTTWKQTSYNGNFRGNYAGIGFTYMSNVATLGVASTDIFISQQPHASWGIGRTDAKWIAGLPQPTLTSDEIAAGKYYIWDETAHQADGATPKTVGWALTTGGTM
tara:strand:+ start:107 stop:559 length:453 start_codon:yes stop_codon:yes gene_type:complete